MAFRHGLQWLLLFIKKSSALNMRIPNSDKNETT